MKKTILRRTFLSLAAAAPGARGEERVPVDLDKLDAFAKEYNAYAAKLHEGVVDVKQWKKTAAAWRALE